MSGIVFDTIAITHFFDESEVIVGATFEAFRFQVFSGSNQFLETFCQLIFNALKSAFRLRVVGDEMLCWKSEEFFSPSIVMVLLTDEYFIALAIKLSSTSRIIFLSNFSVKVGQLQTMVICLA
jgi:hypothetical protein